MDQSVALKLKEFWQKIDHCFLANGEINHGSPMYQGYVAECMELGIKLSQIGSVEDYVINQHYMTKGYYYSIPEEITAVFSA